MLGVGSGSTKSSKIRRIIKNGLQAWYKADATQAPLGEEEIVNGDFAIASGSGVGWTANGAATTTGGVGFLASSPASSLVQNNLVSGRTYYFSIEAKTDSSGNIKISNNGVNFFTNSSLSSSFTTFTGYFTSAANDLTVGETGSGGITIDNVSVREVVNSVKDSSANNNNGVLYSGKALSFDGSADKIDFGNPGYSMKTVAFWINVADVTSNTEQLMEFQTSNGISSINGTITTAGTWTGEVIYVDGDTGTTITAGTWHRVVLTTTATITVNDFVVGFDDSNYGDFDIADLQIYDKVWTASDVTYDYNNPDKDVFDNSNSAIITTDCLALYRLNEGAGDRVYNAAPVLKEDVNKDYDFTSGWSSLGTNTVVNSSNTFTTDNGGIFKAIAVSGNSYKLTIAGTTTASIFKIIDASGSTAYFTYSSGGSFSSTLFITAESGSNPIGTAAQFYCLNTGPVGSVTTVTTFKVEEISLSDSYAQTSWVSGNWITAQIYIPQYAMSSYSKKIIFDGSNDYVALGSEATIAADQAFSFSFWYYNIATSGDQAILGKNASSDDYLLLNEGDEGLDFKANGGSELSFDFDSGLELTAGKLNHIVLTSPGSTGTMKCYLNGYLQDDTETSPNQPFDYQHIFRSNTNYGEGFIDEFSHFSKELSATEVKEIFNFGIALDCRDHSASSDLQGYWRNNGDETWHDLSTNSNNGTVNGSPAVIQLQEVPFFKKDTFGLPMNKVRQNGLNLDGNSYVKVDDDNSLGTIGGGFTCAFWYRHSENTTNPNYFFLVTKGTGLGTNSDNGLSVSIFSDIIFFDLNTDSATGRYNITHSLAAASSASPVWHYITATYNGSDTIKLYTDAVERNENTSVAGSISATAEAHPIVIGSNKDFDSKKARTVIDEVKWYDRDLSLVEITKNYKAQKGKHSSTSNWSDDFSDSFI
tara:strand:- start:2545 stop:5331 length:2787 start_codon:yes stop_codon:yes gene_type:complete